jgi:proline dehydrogenase
MSWINTTLAYLMPYFPRWTVKPFAKHYVAGEELAVALEVAKKLNLQGFAVTMDILGEHVQSRVEATQVREAYCELYHQLALLGKDNTVSLKLTHLGLELDPHLAEENLMAIVAQAKNHGLGLTIDMENSAYTDRTLELYQKAVAVYPQVGTVLQAYLHRSMKDLERLTSPQLHLRLCKGIYREPESIAFQTKEEIRDNYLKLAEKLLLGPGYACLATHDQDLIDRLVNLIETHDLSHDRFEFQVLYGVPMGDRLEWLKDRGYTVRIYVPYGAAWFEYSVRRLKENPNIVGYVLGNLFKH